MPTATRRAKEFNCSLLTCLSGGGGGGGVFSRANSTTLLAASALSRSRSVSRSACLPTAASSVTLNCGRTCIEARRLRPWLLRLSTTALGVTRNRRRAAGDGGGRGRRRCGRLGRSAAKDGVEARRNGAGARARPCVGRSPAALSGASTASLFGSYPWKKRSFPPVHVQCPQIHIHTALCDDDDDCAGCRSNRQQESPALLVRRVAAPRLPRWASAHDRRAQLWAMGAIAVTRRRHSAPRQHRARSLATGGVGRRCLSDASSQQRKGRPLPLPLATATATATARADSWQYRNRKPEDPCPTDDDQVQDSL